jgi:hypothetical protein
MRAVLREITAGRRAKRTQATAIVLSTIYFALSHVAEAGND